MSDWFNCPIGTKQGGCISPTMFSIFINDLAAEINSLDLGIQVDNKKVCILLYAGDIALIASSENDLQRMLDILWGWCRRWRPNLSAFTFALSDTGEQSFNSK